MSPCPAVSELIAQRLAGLLVPYAIATGADSAARASRLCLSRKAASPSRTLTWVWPRRKPRT